MRLGRRFHSVDLARGFPVRSVLRVARTFHRCSRPPLPFVVSSSSKEEEEAEEEVEERRNEKKKKKKKKKKQRDDPNGLRNKKRTGRKRRRSKKEKETRPVAEDGDVGTRRHLIGRYK
ncbi:hypothetical protein K0M31_009226 [Melipona bicolor]|uniref:Uncharacterized protein n=1 Tax=Melipona bicolor TaxID=60889 RepID=A0AA40KJQ2_9HYME|nr:hypothetical protein K0M31_009226 [Melipona bicolor]